jgi:hypothetical protein
MSEYSFQQLVRPETISDERQLVDLVRPDTLRALMGEHPAVDQHKDHLGGLRATYFDKSRLWIFYDENDERVRGTDIAPAPIQYSGPLGYRVLSTAKQMLRLAYQEQEDQGLPSRVWLPPYTEKFDRIVPC